MEDLTNARQRIAGVTIAPLSPTFRIAAGMLFLLGIPTVFSQCLLFIAGPVEDSIMTHLPSIVLQMLSVVISAHVAFTGYAPEFLQGIPGEKSDDD